MSVRVQLENFGFSQKNTETKLFHIGLENLENLENCSPGN